jgi:hypothetical protein
MISNGSFILAALLVVGVTSALLSFLAAALFKWQARRSLGLIIDYKPLVIAQLKSVTTAVIVGIVVQNFATLYIFVSSGQMGNSTWGFWASLITWYFTVPLFFKKCPNLSLSSLPPTKIKKISLNVAGWGFLIIIIIGLALAGISRLYNP